LITEERARQIAQEGWTPAHDDKHTDSELAKAAESYLVAVTTPDEEGDENGKVRPAWDWPWDKHWWKPSPDPVRNLVKAAALIAAEIDRINRSQKCSVENCQAAPAWASMCDGKRTGLLWCDRHRPDPRQILSNKRHGMEPL